ncbi:MAG TPA: YceI family protein [Polyangia bacterium]|jgi:hypothetical protein
MANQIAPAVFSSASRNRSPIELRIHGEDIFLSGRFHRWQAQVSLGSDLDELSAQIAIDATSPDNLMVSEDENERNLFSFRSTSVTGVADNGYKAEGELVTSVGATPYHLSIMVPEGHTAFFLVTLKLRKEQVDPAHWSELVTGSGAGGIDAERLLDPRTGVRDLPVAVA